MPNAIKGLTWVPYSFNFIRTITIENLKLKKLLEQKTEAVIQGREMTEEIDAVDLAMKNIDKEIQELEAKVDIGDLNERAKAITEEFNVVIAKMEIVKKEIFERLKAEVPPDLGVKYEEKKKVKENWETERNKLGLKIQKYKDLIIPLTQKEAKGLLIDEFEDFSDVRLENGEIVIDIFSHLDEWKAARRKKLALK